MPVQVDLVNLDDDLANKEIAQDHGAQLDHDIFDKHDNESHGYSLQQKHEGIGF